MASKARTTRKGDQQSVGGGAAAAAAGRATTARAGKQPRGGAAAGRGGPADQQVLARVLKEAIKSGKYTIGTKEVISELKSAKMVIAASTHSSDGSEKKSLAQEAKKSNVPLVGIDRSSAQLGRMLGRPFRVSAIAVRVVAESDYRQLVGLGQTVGSTSVGGSATTAPDQATSATASAHQSRSK
jgi:large subunit ribosomal protein L30e